MGKSPFYCDCGKSGCEAMTGIKRNVVVTASSTSSTIVSPSSSSSSTTAVLTSVEKNAQKLALIESHYHKTGEKWIDPDFPPNHQALLRDPHTTKRPEWKELIWRRPEEMKGMKNPILFESGADPLDINQGAIGDCWFMSAISVMTQRQQDLMNIFVSKEHSPAGVYSVNFWKNGELVNILIDSNFPCIKHTNTAAFGHSANSNELWVMILEKAYAKLHHCLAFDTKVRVYEDEDHQTTKKNTTNKSVVIESLKCGDRLLNEAGDPITVTKFATSSTNEMIRIEYDGGHHLVTRDHLVTLRCRAYPKLTRRCCGSSGSNAIESIILTWHGMNPGELLPSLQQREWRFATTASTNDSSIDDNATPHMNSMPILPYSMISHVEQFAFWWLSGLDKRSHGRTKTLRAGDLFEVSAKSLLRASPQFFKDYQIPLANDQYQHLDTENNDTLTQGDVQTHITPSKSDDRSISTDDNDDAASSLSSSSSFITNSSFDVELELIHDFMRLKGFGTTPDVSNAISTHVALIHDTHSSPRNTFGVKKLLEGRVSDAVDYARLVIPAVDTESEDPSLQSSSSYQVNYSYPSARIDSSVDIVYMLQTPLTSDSSTMNSEIRQLERVWKLLHINPDEVGEKIMISSMINSTSHTLPSNQSQLDSSCRESIEFALSCHTRTIIVFGSSNYNHWIRTIDTCDHVIHTEIHPDENHQQRPIMTIQLDSGENLSVHFVSHLANYNLSDIIQVISQVHKKSIPISLNQNLSRSSQYKQITNIEVVPGDCNYVLLEVSGSGRFVLDDNTITHNCFEAIESGFVDSALVDLSGGIGSRIDMSKDPSKKEARTGQLFQQLVSYRESGFLLGAGSPAGSDSEANASPSGIIQGHAYAILDVQDIDGNQLIRLRNPWGRKEWTGDWCDTSDKWTRRLRAKLNFVAADDGAFWMCMLDFARHFEEIYVCRSVRSKRE
jgi:hypothetical protein